MSQLTPQVSDLEAAPAQEIVAALEAMVTHPEYPCLGARSVFRRDRATVRVYDELAGDGVAEQLLGDLQAFAQETDIDEGFASFVATFRAPDIADELQFERLLWAQLRRLHATDTEDWDDRVARDPDDEHFSFSAGGTAYFIVGLHPKASREARRTPMPTLVFNLHEQFVQLRESGQFPRMRDQIRRRDEQLQGSLNPMIADYGQASEARQYSGRQVGPDWEAPFDAQDVGA